VDVVGQVPGAAAGAQKLQPLPESRKVGPPIDNIPIVDKKD